MAFKEHCEKNKLLETDPIDLTHTIQAAKLCIYIYNYKIKFRKSMKHTIEKYIPMKFIEKFVIGDMLHYYNDDIFVNKSNLQGFIDLYSEDK